MRTGENGSGMTEHAFAELGLSADATDQEVKAAWRRLVSRWHPDRNASAQAVAKIQRINQAFEAIRRAREEQPDLADTPTTTQEAPAADPPSAADDGPSHAPIRRKLRMTLEEAAAGCVKLVRGRIKPLCTACDGMGHQVLGGHCRSCRGSGAVVRPSIWFGWPGTKESCEACHGSGILRQTCAACAGSGKGEILTYQVQVRIPPGVRDGDLLHVAARRARRNPAPADLEIQVAVAPHDFLAFDADGALHCSLPVDGFAWMAQRTVQVPTVDGLQPLALRRGQLRYRLAGQGFPRDRGGPRGDQTVDIVPVFPERFSTDQNILLDQLMASQSDPQLRASQQGLRAWERKRKRP